jgi:hypothetical protein
MLILLAITGVTDKRELANEANMPISRHRLQHMHP